MDIIFSRLTGAWKPNPVHTGHEVGYTPKRMPSQGEHIMITIHTHINGQFCVNNLSDLHAMRKPAHSKETCVRASYGDAQDQHFPFIWKDVITEK